ncbi:hypothetical protein Ciccas_001703 [Cichlidogyrus casuarinus]|uniref:Uncharacterized protein n=1 Tax=Cichlidogyrus casuarinus TaxID=1844966 RepID=A0ABD2QJ96_9PLAT
MKSLVDADCETKATWLLGTWYTKVIQIFAEKNSLPSLKPDKMDSFFNFITTLISNQLKMMLKQNLNRFVSFFDEENKMHWFCLKTYLTFECDQVLFYPPKSDLVELFIFIADRIIQSLPNIPKVQAWLNSRYGEPSTLIDTMPDPETQDLAKSRLEKIATNLFVELESFRDEIFVKPYTDLFNGNEQAKVDQFLASEKPIEDYCEFIASFQAKAAKVMELRNVELFPFIRLDCEQIKKSIRDQYLEMANKLIMRLANDNRDICDYVNAKFEEIRERCHRVPQNSEELRANEVILYLIEEYEFSEQDIQRNAAMITWRSRIGADFDKNEKLQEQMRGEGEQRLYAKREKLIGELAKLRIKVEDLNECGETSLDMIQQYLVDIRALQKRIGEARSTANWIEKEEALYKVTPSSYPEVTELQNMTEPFQKLFSIIQKYNKSEKKWFQGEFESLNADEIEAEVEETWREVFKLQKQFQTRFKKMRMEQDERRRENKHKKHEEGALEEGKTEVMPDEEDVKPPMAINTIAKFQEQIKNFKDIIPTISVLCNPGIRKRHWEQMSEIAGQNLTPDSGTSLSKMLQLQLDPYMEQFTVISGSATKEYTLETNMSKMVNDWNSVEFNLSSYRESGISILASVDEIQQLLDDQIIKTQTMRGSPFIKPFEVEIKAWEAKILRIQETIDEWLKMQAQWLYLEPIFSSEDIMQQMPEEGRQFTIVDRNFKEIMKNTEKNTSVLVATEMTGLLERIKESNNMLDKINKGLNAYLEKKRLFFPRFFFLSNDEMLEILSETKDPMRVQPHLKNICTVEARGAVEKWLLQVQDSMLLSVKDVIRAAKNAYSEVPRPTWVTQWPGQVVICVGQIYWTSEVHESFQYGEQGLAVYKEQLDRQIGDIVKLVRGKLNAQQRITLGALVVIEVHARDVVGHMVTLKVSQDNDFEWLSQLRYYWEEDNCLVRITNATVNYAYEYLGNSPRLVITPLTDRCYRTLVGAYHLNLNGAPEGPAGTGKTETTKDLAKALAVQCVV